MYEYETCSLDNMPTYNAVSAFGTWLRRVILHDSALYAYLNQFQEHSMCVCVCVGGCLCLFVVA